MFKNGWMRLWIVVTAVLLLIAFGVSAYSVWGTDACYRFVSVSIAKDAEQQDNQLAESVKREAMLKAFCGKSTYSAVLTLEDLAQRGVVTQIGFQWLEPNGWSFDRDSLDVLNGTEITAEEIIDRASSYVHNARLLVVRWLIVATLSISILLLVLGLAIAWIRRGFAN